MVGERGTREPEGATLQCWYVAGMRRGKGEGTRKVEKGGETLGDRKKKCGHQKENKQFGKGGFMG